MDGIDPANDGEEVPDPLTELVQMAVSIHEMVGTYVEAGFSRMEAIYLVGVIIGTMSKG